MDWERIDSGLDGKQIAEFRNQHGDTVTIEDTYPNPVPLLTARQDRYKVTYESDNESTARFGPRRDREETFARREDAASYAVETLMGENLENYSDLET